MWMLNDDPVFQSAALFGGLCCLFSLVSYFIKERLHISETLVALLAGILFGPWGFEVLTPGTWELHREVAQQFSRIIIAVQVMAVGVSLPPNYLWKQRKSLFILLGPVLIFSWIITSIILRVCIGISWPEALAAGIALAPTDPVLANSVVKGKFAEENVPEHVRDIISAESGANDGVAYPLLHLSILLILRSTLTAPSITLSWDTFSYWLTHTFPHQIILAIIFGYGMGHAARIMLRGAEDRGLIDKESFLAFSFALALFVMGVVAMLGGDDLLAVFFAGNAFTCDDWFRVETLDAHLQAVIDQLFNLSFFLFLGAYLPTYISFSHPLLPHLVLSSSLILLLRRPPAILIASPFIPVLNTAKEVGYVAWFGPMGVAAVCYSLEAMELLISQDAQDAHLIGHRIVTIVLSNVVASIFIHGVTVPTLRVGAGLNQAISRSFSHGLFRGRSGRSRDVDDLGLPPPIRPGEAPLPTPSSPLLPNSSSANPSDPHHIPRYHAIIPSNARRPRSSSYSSPSPLLDRSSPTSISFDRSRITDYQRPFHRRQSPSNSTSVPSRLPPFHHRRPSDPFVHRPPTGHSSTSANNS